MVKVMNHWSKLLRKQWSLHIWMSSKWTLDILLERKGLQKTEGHTGANVKCLETLIWWENSGIGKIRGRARIKHSMPNPTLKDTVFGEWHRCRQWCCMRLSRMQMGAESHMRQPFGPVFGCAGMALGRSSLYSSEEQKNSSCPGSTAWRVWRKDKERGENEESSQERLHIEIWCIRAFLT